jgi:hypothetical protein
MIRILLLIPLAACAVPQQNCKAQATRALATVQTLIAQTQTTIARGYAIERRSSTILYTEVCPDGDGTIANSFCDRLQPVTTQVPMAVDLNAERAKLRDLKRKEAALAPKAATALRRCRG